MLCQRWQFPLSFDCSSICCTASVGEGWRKCSSCVSENSFVLFSVTAKWYKGCAQVASLFLWVGGRFLGSGLLRLQRVMTADAKCGGAENWRPICKGCYSAMFWQLSLTEELVMSSEEGHFRTRAAQAIDLTQPALTLSSIHHMCSRHSRAQHKALRSLQTPQHNRMLHSSPAKRTVGKWKESLSHAQGPVLLLLQA